MQTMKLSEALNTFNGEAFFFGGKAAGRKNAKKELVTVKAELHPRGIVKLLAEDGTEVLHSRTGTVIFAGPVDQAEEPKKTPRKAAPKKAVKAPEKAEEKAEAAEVEKPALIPGKAPKNFIELAHSANTEAARRYWTRRVAQYEG
jgi:hypothetical protein